MLAHDFPGESRNYDKPELFGRAGIVVDPDVDRPGVRGVFPDSPAAEAGVVPDDVILERNDNPATAARLETAFTHRSGTILQLTLRDVLYSDHIRQPSGSLLIDSLNSHISVARSQCCSVIDEFLVYSLMNLHSEPAATSILLRTNRK